MASTDTKQYRIPHTPVGIPYYRKGTLYEPGSVVSLPADEAPPGWRTNEDGSMEPTARHAWRLLEPGKKEKSETELSEVERARNEAAEAQEKLAEAQRLLAEAEAKAALEEAPKRGRPALDDEQPEATPNDPDAEAADDGDEGEGKGKKKGRRRAADQDL